ncbi:Fc receptor-like protein 5 [Clinocottus analis]|uniref:Fc receptor-like protein 5 n=1 Tax=Clinocottus analis TaxID=304258 RepID=UPI0035C1342A
MLSFQMDKFISHKEEESTGAEEEEETQFTTQTVVTLQPDWPEIYSGETITLTCDIQDGGDAEWEYLWRTPRSYRPQNLRRSMIRASHSGDYELMNILLYCGHAQDVLLSIEPNWSTFFTGENVTFRCDIRKGRHADWYYSLQRDGHTFPPNSPKRRFPQSLTPEHSGRQYQCVAAHKSSPAVMIESNKVSLTVSGKDVVLETPAASVPEGESVTLHCRHRNKRKEKNAVFYRDGSLIEMDTNPPNTTSISLKADGSFYKCKFDDEESEPIKLRMKQRPTARLSKYSPAVGRVTMTCSVTSSSPSSSGWKYFWYRGKKTSEPINTEDVALHQNGEIRVSQGGRGGGGVYWCRGGSGDPVYYSEYSDPVVTNRAVVTLQPDWPEIYSGETITLTCDIQDGGDAEWEYLWNSGSASLSVSPDRLQHFSKESLSLSCEGNATEWRVKRFTKPDRLSSCSDWGTMTGSTCNMDSNGFSGVYWCESETGQFSNAANITIQRGDVILVSSVHPVTEGHPVTLSCKFKTEKILHNVDFYKNGKLIPNHTSGQLFISEVTKSDEGFYKCKGSDSPQSLKSLTSSENAAASSPFPVLLVVGLVCGVSLIILLLLFLYRCRKSKGSRLMRSQSTNQSAATDHMTNQGETQDNTYASLLHGDSCLYETIRGSEEAEHGKNTEPEESVYSNVTMGTAAGGPQPVLTVSPSWPSPGGSVALTCSVEHPSAGWSFFWYKGQKTSKPVITTDNIFLINELIGDSQEGGRGGVYWCRGGRGDPVYYSEYSDPVVTNRAVVTLQPDWPEIYSGETITLTCDIQDGGDAEWEYLWRTPRSYRPQNPKRSMIKPSHSGDYKCRGKLKDENSFTEWSDAFTIKASGPQPVLTVSPSWPSPGGSVALTCSVEHPSAGWSFFWYQLVPKRSDYSYEPLPGSTKGTEQDSYIVHGQTHTAGYVCRAARGDPVFYSLYSKPKFIWSGDSGSASLSVSPDRLQHFRKESLSLSCEGNATEWRVRRFTKPDRLSSCSDWGTMTGSTCNMDRYWFSGVHWCESETGQFSNAANITIQSGDVILVSSVHPVTEGHPVTLSCKFKTEKILHNVDFYKNGKLIPNHTSGQLFISEVTKSDEGFYKCKGSDSPQSLKSLTSSASWLSVKFSEDAAASSPFPVLLVVGLVCGVSLIILLLLFLYRCRKSKGSRLMRSQSTNQSAATDHMTNQGKNTEPEESVYSNVMMGTAAVVFVD